MDQQYGQLVDALKEASAGRQSIIERFMAMPHPVDPLDPIHHEWDDADTAVEEARRAIIDYLPPRR
jgi:hypothetical protein